MKTLIALIAISLILICSSIEFKAENPSIDPVWDYCKSELNMDYDYYIDVFIETDEYCELYDELCH